MDLIGIQILRGIAASLVVFHHSLEESLASVVLPTSPDWLTTFGASGVDIFFVISGFMMVYTSFPRSNPVVRPTSFLKKRISRVYPFYWFCVLTALSLWSVGFFHKFDVTPWSVVRALLLLPTDTPIIGVSWTLVYEMYFYIIFAGALFMGSRIGSTILAAGIIVVVLAMTNLVAESSVFLSNPIVLEFCFGMFLAFWFYNHKFSILIVKYGWIVGFTLLGVAAWYVPHETTNGLPASVRWIVWGIPALVVVASFLEICADSRLQRWSVVLGDASYAIYLTHPFVMITYAKILKTHPSLTAISQLPFVPVVFAICLVVGIAAHMLVERPLIDLSRGRIKRQKPIISSQIAPDLVALCKADDLDVVRREDS